MLTREKKAKIIEEIINIFNNYKTIGFVDFFKLPTREYREMKKKLNSVNIKFFKKSLVIKTLERLNKKELINYLPNACGILFTNREPFEVYREIKRLVTYRYAKENDIAEEDIVIKPMVTNIPAGMAIAEFQRLKIEVGVEAGKIAIKKEKVLVKKGEKISKEVASILQKLNIKPIPIRIKVTCLTDKKIIYPKEILDLDENYYIQQILKIFSFVSAICEKIGLITRYNISNYLKRAYLNALELSVKAEFFCERTISEILRRAIIKVNIFKSLNKDMEYVYAALLLYEAKKEITEESIRKILEAAGIVPDEAKIKSLVESLKNINIEEVLKSTTLISQPQVIPQQQEIKKEKGEEEKKKEEEKKREEEAVAGLSALFGL